MKKLKPLTELKRRPKTLVELFKDKRRWVKGRLHTFDYRKVCVRGGINYLATGDPGKYRHDRLEKVEKRIEAIICKPDYPFKPVKLEPPCPVVHWNNSPELTHREFMRVLKKAKV